MGQVAQIEAAKDLIRRDAAFQEWAQSYLDPGRWAGHDRGDAVKTELLERDATISTLQDAAFHFLTCRQHKASAFCESCEKFEAFLRGEPDGESA